MKMAAACSCLLSFLLFFTIFAGQYRTILLAIKRKIYDNFNLDSVPDPISAMADLRTRAVYVRCMREL